MLKQENALLKSTIADAKVSIAELSDALTASDVKVPASLGLIEGAQGFEDYWSPCVEVPAGSAFVEEYGAVQPVPAHDGTECFKWDNQMWSAADHFKVCVAQAACMLQAGLQG